jgi:hypothetical protein
MTRRTRKVVMLVAAATALAVMPVVGTLAITYVAARNQSQARLTDITNTVARRVEAVFLSTEAALADVAFDARNGCTEDLVREFRNKTIDLGRNGLRHPERRPRLHKLWDGRTAAADRAGPLGRQRKLAAQVLAPADR